MDIYSSQIETKNEIIQTLKTCYWCLLAAHMQSGKTIAYLLTAFEMLRLEKVKVCAIISGNNEIILRQQIINDIQQFKQLYKRYLDENGIRCGRWIDIYEWVDETADKFVDDIASKIDVAFGHELKKFKQYDVSENPLYIWDESHYGQSKNQEIDKFFRVRGIQPSGTNGNGMVISVSATHNAELSDIHHFKQTKGIVRLKPSGSYIGVNKFRQNGQINNISDLKRDFPRILRRHLENKIGLIRATEQNQKWMIPMATRYGYKCEKFDMTTTFDFDELLSTEPLEPTLVFLKRKCCMGKHVIKLYIGFVIETTYSKTDTILQGLLGRMCGYDSREDIMIYIFKYDNQKEGLDRYIDFHDGNDKSIAKRAMNIREIKDKLHPTIPSKIVFGPDPEGPDPEGPDPEDCIIRRVLEKIEESHYSSLEENAIYQSNSQQVWDDVIVTRILRNGRARLIPPSERSDEEKILASLFKIHKQGRVYEEALPKVEEAWRQNTEQCAFGSGAGAGVSDDEVIIWSKVINKGEINEINICYIAMQYADINYVQVPKTTQKEIFCIHNTTGGAEFSVPRETRTQPYKLEEVIDALIEASRLLDPPVLSSNGHGNHILMNEEVFEYFKRVIEEKWKPQTTIRCKMVSGRRPAGMTDVRIASITWTKLRANL